MASINTEFDRRLLSSNFLAVLQTGLSGTNSLFESYYLAERSGIGDKVLFRSAQNVRPNSKTQTLN